MGPQTATDLINWLRAQLDADERMALAAQDAAPEQSGRWHAAYARDDLDPTAWLIATAPLSFTPLAGPGLTHAVAAHIATWDPARVLAEVKAKRAILDLHTPYMNRKGDVQCDHCMQLCHSESGLGCDDPDAPYPCETVTLTAQPYAGRHGWPPGVGVGGW
jgi:hypothetical protein